VEQLGDADAGGQGPDGLAGGDPGGGGDATAAAAGEGVADGQGGVGAGTTITTAATPRKASSWPSTATLAAGGRGAHGRDRAGELVEVGQVVAGDLGKGQVEPLLALLAVDAEAFAVGVAHPLQHGQVGRP
jgi:hypothetical protein